MAKKLTTEEFISKANHIHDFKYDYSKTIYNNSKDKIIIICKEHGEFLQIPSNHLAGNNCPICSKNSLKIYNKDFIEKANIVHNNKYTYDKINYINSQSKLIITCPIHGDFEQVAYSHLSNRGCPECGKQNRNKSLDKFIDQANKIHNFKYDYSKTIYKDYKTLITIICPMHGEFEQTPTRHLNSKGCLKCANSSRLIKLNDFITISNIIHGNKYDYSFVTYNSSLDKVKIICPIHGEFFKDIKNHLKGAGCKKCSNTEFILNDFIDYCNIIHHNKYDYSKVNYVNSKTKICIICPDHGEFWQRTDTHKVCGCPSCNISKGEESVKNYLIENSYMFKQNYTIDIKSIARSKTKVNVDFYLKLDNIEYIIEYNGIQHYEFNSFFFDNEEEFIKQQNRDAALRNYCADNNIKLLEIKYTDFKNINKIIEKFLNGN